MVYHHFIQLFLFSLVELVRVYSCLQELNAVSDTAIQKIYTDIGQAEISIRPIVGCKNLSVKAAVLRKGLEGCEEQFYEACIERESGLSFTLYKLVFKVMFNQFLSVFFGTNSEIWITDKHLLKLFKLQFLGINGLIANHEQI